MFPLEGNGTLVCSDCCPLDTPAAVELLTHRHSHILCGTAVSVDSYAMVTVNPCCMRSVLYAVVYILGEGTAESRGGP